MTDPSVALMTYLRNLGTELDDDFLRESIELLSQLLMDLEVEQLTGAKKYEGTPQRQERRNGYREGLGRRG